MSVRAYINFNSFLDHPGKYMVFIIFDLFGLCFLFFPTSLLSNISKIFPPLLSPVCLGAFRAKTEINPQYKLMIFQLIMLL